MNQTLKEDLGLIASKIMESASNKFTGKMTLTVHMRDGGIGRMNLVLDSDLKYSTKKK